MNTNAKATVLGLSLSVLAAASCAAQPVPPPAPAPHLLAPQPTPPAPPAPVGLAPAAEAAKPSGARIQFETTIGDFGKVQKGLPAKYTFIFTNTGTDVLELKEVKPGCGCTTAGDWTKKVEPGKTGVIPIQVNSQNFNGPITKFVTVTCTDPKTPTTTLQMKGTIWVPIDISSQYITLQISEDNPHPSAPVTIVNHLETPLYVSAPECSNKGLVTELKTNTPGTSYQLMVSCAAPMPPGAPSGVITMKTSSTNMPEIRITAWVSEQPQVSAFPMQLQLPQRLGAVPHAMVAANSASGTNAPSVEAVLTPAKMLPPLVLTIVHNSTNNNLKLSDPAVTVAGVASQDVRINLNESQPGHFFNVSLAFPETFEVAQGQPIEFTVKTSNAKHPLIRVPIIRPQRPMASAPPPVPVAGNPQPTAPILPTAHKLPTPPPKTATQ